MKLVAMGLVAVGVLFAASAQAGTASPSDLLSQATVGAVSAADPLTVSELADIRGEGTFEKFIALPNLHRSWETHVNLENGLIVSIVGVAHEGISISITNPAIP